MTRVYLVRHAQAAEPGDLRLPGPDLSLTELGRRQSEALGRRLCRHRPVALYSSDSARARETADAIVRGFVGPEVPQTIDPFLREIDFGEWGGRTYDEVVAEQASATAARYASRSRRCLAFPSTTSATSTVPRIVNDDYLRTRRSAQRKKRVGRTDGAG